MTPRVRGTGWFPAGGAVPPAGVSGSQELGRGEGTGWEQHPRRGGVGGAGRGCVCSPPSQEPMEVDPRGNGWAWQTPKPEGAQKNHLCRQKGWERTPWPSQCRMTSAKDVGNGPRPRSPRPPGLGTGQPWRPGFRLPGRREAPGGLSRHQGGPGPGFPAVLSPPCRHLLPSPAHTHHCPRISLPGAVLLEQAGGNMTDGQRSVWTPGHHGPRDLTLPLGAHSSRRAQRPPETPSAIPGSSQTRALGAQGCLSSGTRDPSRARPAVGRQPVLPRTPL